MNVWESKITSNISTSLWKDFKHFSKFSFSSMDTFLAVRNKLYEFGLNLRGDWLLKPRPLGSPRGRVWRSVPATSILIYTDSWLARNRSNMTHDDLCAWADLIFSHIKSEASCFSHCHFYCVSHQLTTVFLTFVYGLLNCYRLTVKWGKNLANALKPTALSIWAVCTRNAHLHNRPRTVNAMEERRNIGFGDGRKKKFRFRLRKVSNVYIIT